MGPDGIGLNYKDFYPCKIRNCSKSNLSCVSCFDGSRIHVKSTLYHRITCSLSYVHVSVTFMNIAVEALTPGQDTSWNSDRSINSRMFTPIHFIPLWYAQVLCDQCMSNFIHSSKYKIDHCCFRMRLVTVNYHLRLFLKYSFPFFFLCCFC
jgi:hypothetical protein